MKRRVLDSIADQTPHFDRIGLDLGYVYEKGAIVPDGSEPDQAANLVNGVPAIDAARGEVPPSLAESADEHPIPTHDLLDPARFTLLLGDGADAWRDAAVQVQGSLRSKLQVLELGSLCDTNEAQRALEQFPAGLGMTGLC